MIPAGLKEGEVEFFVDGNNFNTMYSGRLMPYEQLPSSIHEIVAAAIDTDASSALDSMNLVDWQERHVQFLRCNCARYDFTPDIEPGSLLLQREHVKCSIRGHCPVEGKLCKPILINGHKITPTELKVISHITAGHSDKVICSKLNIAVDTLRTHKRNIQPKLGALTKVQIATQSIKYGIS